MQLCSFKIPTYSNVQRLKSRHGSGHASWILDVLGMSCFAMLRDFANCRERLCSPASPASPGPRPRFHAFRRLSACFSTSKPVKNPSVQRREQHRPSMAFKNATTASRDSDGTPLGLCWATSNSCDSQIDLLGKENMKKT